MWQIPTKQITGGSIQMLGFGTSRLKPEVFTPVVTAAIKSGIRYIDTASYYKNFHLLRSALESVYSNKIAERKDLFIASKVWSNEQRDVRKTCETALKQINTDYLDLFLVHWPWCYKEVDGTRQLDFVPRHKV